MPSPSIRSGCTYGKADAGQRRLVLYAWGSSKIFRKCSWRHFKTCALTEGNNLLYHFVELPTKMSHTISNLRSLTTKLSISRFLFHFEWPPFWKLDLETYLSLHCSIDWFLLFRGWKSGLSTLLNLIEQFSCGVMLPLWSERKNALKLAVAILDFYKLTFVNFQLLLF